MVFNKFFLMPPLQVAGRREAKSGKVFSRLEGGGWRGRGGQKGSFYFPLGMPSFHVKAHFYLQCNI